MSHRAQQSLSRDNVCMKVSRLLSVVLLLQVHGRMTTQQLADRFEVSTRTILRDVEALSAAGVPVHAERGRHGAIVLDTQSRLDLSRLEPSELQLLTAVGVNPEQLAQIGLGEVSAHTRDKLTAASRRQRAGEPTLSDVLLIDPAGWFTPTATQDLSSLLAAAREGRRLIVTYRHSGHATADTHRVDPYGLVSKQAAWYLVGDVDGTPRMFNTNRLVEHEVLDEPAELRSGQSLTQIWAQLVGALTADSSVEIRALLRASRLDIAARILGSRLIDVSEPNAGWLTITVAYPEVESVRQLLQFGDHIQVLTPPEAVQRVRDLAHQLVEAHGSGDSIEVSGQDT